MERKTKGQKPSTLYGFLELFVRWVSLYEFLKGIPQGTDEFDKKKKNVHSSSKSESWSPGKGGFQSLLDSWFEGLEEAKVQGLITPSSLIVASTCKLLGMWIWKEDPRGESSCSRAY